MAEDQRKVPGAVPRYRKLPGRGAGFGEASRLFLAEDHLLLVTATGFNESYRRFYLRDIQALTVRKTLAGVVVSAVLGVVSFILLIIMILEGPPNGWIIPLGLIVGLLVVNIVQGSTCHCEIHTAVQSRRLGSVSRLRTARKLLAQLRPVIEAAQAPLSMEDLRRRIDESRRYNPATSAPPVIRPGGWSP